MLHFPSPDIGMFGRRQRHVRGHRIPVTITRDAKASPDCVVVIDTFGANDVAPLPGGCACCTVRAELQSALRRLSAKREKKPFSRVVVESEQDLARILRTFASDRVLGGDYYVEDAPPLDGDGFMLTEDTPISRDGFSRFAATLTALRGPDLLQVKGLLNVTGCRGPVAVHLMGHLAARPVELQAWPAGEHTSRLKFVARNIDERTVRAMLEAVRALA
jgi:G3E family GTPase